jgi:hypothetical protein
MQVTCPATKDHNWSKRKESHFYATEFILVRQYDQPAYGDVC